MRIAVVDDAKEDAQHIVTFLEQFQAEHHVTFDIKVFLARKDLMREYNNIPASDTGERSRGLELMIGSFGRNARINQPFDIDYGKNIAIGENSFINVNCTLLDTGTSTIWKNTLIGPDVRICTAVQGKDGYERFWAEQDGTMAVKSWAEPAHIGDFVWIDGGSDYPARCLNRKLCTRWRRGWM